MRLHDRPYINKDKDKKPTLRVMFKKKYEGGEVFDRSLEYFGGDEMAASTWMKKYCMVDEDGDYVELTPDDMHRRMAHFFSEAERHYETEFNEQKDGHKKMKLSEYGYSRGELDEDKIYSLFKDFKYVIPAGSVMSGLGNPKPLSLSNCWVINGPGDSLEEIFRVCNEQSQLMKRRGGVGFDISGLRPNGSVVNNSAKTSTGAASFMELFSHVTNTISQNGRRGALMLSIDIKHPDAVEFIEKKQDLTKVTGANVSVQIDDEFMKAVESDSDYIQQWPIDGCINWDLTKHMAPNDAIDGEFEYDRTYPMTYTDNSYSSVSKVGYFRKIKAKQLWERLIHCAWNTAEPGIMFKTRHHQYSPDGVYPQFRGTCTNPCLSGDSLITTPDGDISIKELVSKINDGVRVEVLTYNEREAVCEYKVARDGFLTLENTEVIEIECEDSTSLKLTPDHKVFTENRGYVEASMLTSDDVLVMHDQKRNRINALKTIENEDVYDLTVEDNHNFFANGILVHNCGEIFMNEDSCRLIHVNLSSFVLNPFTDNATLDEKTLYEVTYETMRLGDDLVYLEELAIRNILKKIERDNEKGNSEYRLYERLLSNSLQGRRCGLGFLGLSDAIAELGLKYDSDEAIEMVSRIMNIMFVAEMDCQIDMALTRGAFPAFNRASEEEGNEWYEMLKKEYPEIYRKNMTFGRRNISFNTVAPTGTVSLMAKCSSGIEPVFMPYYMRRVKCMKSDDKVDYVDQNGEKFTEYIVVHPTFKKWAEATYETLEGWKREQWEEAFRKSPWSGSTAQEIDWVQRVRLQGEVQKHITHSISSTINLPNNVTEGEVSTIYMAAWKENLKGITVYRDGCRSGVLVSTENKSEKKEKAEQPQSPKRRPKTLDCKIFRFSNKGEKWVSVVGMMDGEPYEIFSGMQDKLNIPTWVEEGQIVKNYEMSTDPETGQDVKHSRYDICYLDKDGYKVCVEGLSRIFNPEYWNYAKLISGLLRHKMGIQYIIKVISTLKLDSTTINTWKNGIIRTLRKFEKMNESDEKCPSCGGRLVRDGGCIHCMDCGWSRCE